MHTHSQGLILIDSVMNSLLQKRCSMHQMMIFIIGVINIIIILHLSPHNYSTSNQDKKHFKAQKVQGNDGIGNGVGGRRGMKVM